VGARSKAYVCGRSLAGIAGSDPAGAMDICLLCVLCDVTGLIPRPEDSYRVCSCVIVCDQVQQ